MEGERQSEQLNRSTAFDNKLRPTDFDGFVGQEKIRDRLMLAVKAAKDRGESLDHVLFSGPPGLGKTTLSYILGAAMRPMRVVAPTSVKRGRSRRTERAFGPWSSTMSIA